MKSETKKKNKLLQFLKGKPKTTYGMYGTKSILDKVVLTVTLLMLVIVCFVQVYMVFWSVCTAFKDDIDLFLDMFGLPPVLRWENYTKVLKLIAVDLYVPSQGYIKFELPVLFRNSILLALVLPIQGMIVGQISAYIFAKYDFKGRSFMLAVNYFIIIFPISGGLSASLKINNLLGRYDNLLLQCIMGAHPFGGLSLLVQMGFYRSIPKEMMEAAEIDGAGPWTVFLKIHVPLVMPVIMLYYILGLFGSWNDYNTPLVWLPSYPNVALGIYQFQYDSAKYGATLPEVIAAFLMMSIPTIIFYVVSQDFITSKMVMAGLKE